MEEIYYVFNPWWEEKDFDSGITREEYLNRIKEPLGKKQIEVIIGSRRIGKTTFLKQLIKRELKNKFPPKQILYLALDHPQLSKNTISEHLKFFRKLFMHNRSKKLLLFLAEVQESPNWQAELKAIYDSENVKIICSGSTSSLIKSQGGKLTGRQIITTIYPLSFKEFLSFKKIRLSFTENYKSERLVEDYLETGGYPENVLTSSQEYLYNLLEDIIARDLIRLFSIKKANLLKDLFRLLAASCGSRISFNKLAHTLSISVDTVKEYIGYFESAFLVKSMEKWTTSYSEKIYAAKKIYLLDTGMKTLFTGRGDLGAKAENSVFLHFLRNKKPCGYYAESEREVDFVVGDFKNPIPVEVKYISEFNWQDKRFSGIKLFLRRFPGIKEALIISKDVETEINERGTVIKVIPLWKFLRDKSSLARILRI